MTLVDEKRIESTTLPDGTVQVFFGALPLNSRFIHEGEVWTKIGEDDAERCDSLKSLDSESRDKAGRRVDKMSSCPVCQAEWDYEVDGKKFSHLIGVEDSSIYDGVSWWRCPECNAMWDRWTGKRKK